MVALTKRLWPKRKIFNGQTFQGIYNLPDTSGSEWLRGVDAGDALKHKKNLTQVTTRVELVSNLTGHRELCTLSWTVVEPCGGDLWAEERLTIQTEPVRVSSDVFRSARYCRRLLCTSQQPLLDESSFFLSIFLGGCQMFLGTPPLFGRARNQPALSGNQSTFEL